MRSLAGSEDFYDMVASRFGEYRSRAQQTRAYATGNPESIFEQRLLAVSGRTKSALDVGSGDGRFTLAIAEAFGEIVGIERSVGMLEAAQRKRRERNVLNVRFERMDAEHTTFPDRSFDVAYSRRGPTPYGELGRLLKSGGECLHIGIGEGDALELKRVFGRGQGFDRLDTSWLAADQAEQEAAGLHNVYAEAFLYEEYFPTHQELETFLRGVPIFEDFDPDEDRASLERYVTSFPTPKEIILPRHRFVTVARQP